MDLYKFYMTEVDRKGSGLNLKLEKSEKEQFD